MDEAEAKRREHDMGWSVVEDAGRGWRRVVASPLPKEVVELDSVETLVECRRGRHHRGRRRHPGH